MEVTRFTEPELHNLKLMYSGFAVHHQGLTLENFDKFWAQLTGIEKHPFLVDIFMFFDQYTRDQIVDFQELVKGLDIVERGTFDEKTQYCFALYDISE